MTRVELSSKAMRRRYEVATPSRHIPHNSGVVRLASIATASVALPVALEDATTHAEQRSSHMRVLVRPTLTAQTVTYRGRGTVRVEL